ncbi:TIR domain-containing protein [Lentzea sp. NPDC055074]
MSLTDTLEDETPEILSARGDKLPPMEARGPSTGLEELISQVSEFDALAKETQVDDAEVGERTARELAARYEVWFADCLSLLPGDLRQKFRSHYEGSLVFPRIKNFLNEPRRARVKFFGKWEKPPSQNNGRLSYWQHPYESGFQQPVSEQKQILLEAQARLARRPAKTPRVEVRPKMLDNSVFVIHGRDKKARHEFYTFLRAIGLAPIEWTEVLGETGKGLPHIGEVLRNVMSKGRAIIVLSTPDEITQLKPEHADDEDDRELRPTGQARPNVIFEAGMAFALEPDRTLLVEFGKVRRFTDIDGYHAVRLDNSAEKRQLLAQRLEGIGCPVKRVGTDWLQSGDLTPPVTRTPELANGHTGINPSTQGNGNGNGSGLSLDNYTVAADRTVHGEAHNPGPGVKSAILKATFYDAERRIVGTATGAVNQISPGDTKTFTLTTTTHIAAYDSFRVQVDAEF